ncbi:MAG: hypothetical protein IJR14_09030 [Synergistaceae bacterium]|nr:hypothetical protein [Synergistaceae bacterium]
MIEYYGGMRIREPVYEPSLRRFEDALFDRAYEDWGDDEDEYEEEEA